MLGLAVALEARTFNVAFLTDPVGPKALPLVAAGALVGTGLIIVFRPGIEPDWPAPPVLRRLAVATLAFILYALLLQPLGFVVGTVLMMTCLAVLFGAEVKKGLAAASLLCAALWYLFVWVLGLPLPLGALWAL